MQNVAIADQPDELHDPQTFITKYVYSQDHKVIAIQYAITAIFVGLIALALSALMRLQLGFPDAFDFIDPKQLPAIRHHARHDYGDLFTDGIVVGRIR